MADKRVPVRDKYGNITGYRGSGAQGEAEESQINNAGPGGLGGLAARAKAKASPSPRTMEIKETDKPVAVPAGGLTEAQKKMAAEEAEEDAHRRRAPIKPRPKASPKSDY